MVRRVNCPSRVGRTRSDSDGPAVASNDRARRETGEITQAIVREVAQMSLGAKERPGNQEVCCRGEDAQERAVASGISLK